MVLSICFPVFSASAAAPSTRSPNRRSWRSAISSEEDDGRIYRAYADGLREDFRNRPRCSTRWPRRRTGIARALIEPTPQAFRREHPADPPRACARLLRAQAGLAGQAARHRQGARRRPRRWRRRRYRFYVEAAKRTSDAATRKLLGDLAVAEKAHDTLAQRLGLQHAPDERAARGSARPSGGSSS